MSPIILASASPRRRELFSLLNLPFVVHSVDVDETPRRGEAPEVLVARLSATKAAAVVQQETTPRDTLVVAADTVVVVRGAILGKPQTAGEAVEMLRQLRGRRHRVHSGVAVVETSTRRAVIHLKTTSVWMRPYSEDEIERYVASGDPLDKAGAYAIQHAAFQPVSHIEGCYAGVVGLPLSALMEGLAHFGVVPPIRLSAVCRAWSGHACCAAPAPA